MNKPTFYEQLGIIVPGAVLMFGLMVFFPTVRSLLAADGVTVGELGLFVILSYAAGHVVAAVGNFIETFGWPLLGGMPTDWVTRSSGFALLSDAQRLVLQARVKSRLGITETIRGLDRKVWFPISRQLYADVMKNGKPDRIDAFNGNYGLNRGLSAACLVLAGIAILKAEWTGLIVLVAFTGIYAYRAYRFGVHYARELCVQFLTLDSPDPPQAQAAMEVPEDEEDD
jgi:hypothetical protein